MIVRIDASTVVQGFALIQLDTTAKLKIASGNMEFLTAFLAAREGKKYHHDNNSGH